MVSPVPAGSAGWEKLTRRVPWEKLPRRPPSSSSFRLSRKPTLESFSSSSLSQRLLRRLAIFSMLGCFSGGGMGSGVSEPVELCRRPRGETLDLRECGCRDSGLSPFGVQTVLETAEPMLCCRDIFRSGSDMLKFLGNDLLKFLAGIDMLKFLEGSAPRPATVFGRCGRTPVLSRRLPKNVLSNFSALPSLFAAICLRPMRAARRMSSREFPRTIDALRPRSMRSCFLRSSSRRLPGSIRGAHVYVPGMGGRFRVEASEPLWCRGWIWQAGAGALAPYHIQGGHAARAR
mmetsp:Transcript_76120/g.176578  ORF Transcript_76120/g.176578 Transcript_76120/m.176578 type:complete len:289 (+) Transcript_76120:123-989(+)